MGQQEIRLAAGPGVLRSWRVGDAEALARHANSRAVWRNLRDLFPHPYKLADAQRYLAVATTRDPQTGFAIEVEGEAAGGIGIHLQEDVHRRDAEIGYWLGEAFWGRGIMTAAVQAMTEYAFAHFDLCRIHASVFAWNPASMKVLERAGYVREGVLRKSIFKDGQVIDSVLYARVMDRD